MTPNSEVALAILGAFGVVSLLGLMGAYLIIGMAWERSPLRVKGTSQPNGMVSGWILVARAMALRCPNCGQGRIFGSRFQMNAVCPVCGMVFWKSQGEWLGPAVVDYSVATAGGLIAWALLVLIGASPALQLVFGCLAVLVIAVATSRWSRSFWTVLLYISGDLSQTRHTPEKTIT
jgi:uncharacterized protein (DUF983 family)